MPTGPFGQASAGLHPRQVVDAPARMGVDHAEGRGLALQMAEQQAQRGVLVHVGEPAGMIAVLIAEHDR